MSACVGERAEPPSILFREDQLADIYTYRQEIKEDIFQCLKPADNVYTASPLRSNSRTSMDHTCQGVRKKAQAQPLREGRRAH